MKKTTLALTLALVSTGVQSATLDINSLIITGGTWSLGAPGVGICDETSFSSYRCLTPGSAGPLVMGTYQGSSGTGSSLADGMYLGNPFYTFTAASATGAANNPTGLPNGTVDTGAGTMTVDLGGFYMDWNGNSALLGTDPDGTNGTSTAATGNYNPLTGEFDIAWNSYASSGPFNDQMHYWSLTGTAEVSTVPVPAAIWLFGSGLLGLFGWARRK